MPGGDVAGKNAPVSRVTDTEREFSTVVRAQQLSLDGEPLGVARRIADASRTTVEPESERGCRGRPLGLAS